MGMDKTHHQGRSVAVSATNAARQPMGQTHQPQHLP
jgi:hypothetical protein